MDTESAQKKIAILGFGEEGKALFKFLRTSPEFKNNEIWILDKNREIKIPRGAKSKLGESYLKNLSQFDLIFRSPGISPAIPELKAAQAKAVISSGTRIFFEKSPCKIIGITGSKGKSTTATLLYNILKEDKRDAYLAGNIGNSPVRLLTGLTKESIIVLELSSFQLQDLTLSPHLAIVLDVFPEHLDYHENLKEYVNAKTNISKWQKNTDSILYFKNNKYSKKIAAESKGRKLAVIPNSRELENIIENSNISGTQNIKNAVMAVNAAREIGCSTSAIANALKKFKGLEHRLKLVRTTKINQPPISISFYNDSASTNPNTAVAALSAIKEPKILIAGGKDKKLDYKILGQALKVTKTLQVVLYGENRYKIAKCIRKTTVPVILKQDLEKASSAAYEIARSIDAYSKIAVVFSPASASFDMFKNFKERGKKFKKIVRGLK